MLADTHTHLYAEQFDEDRDQIIQRALDRGIEALFLPNIDIHSIDGMLSLEKRYPNNCYAMMGLHPCSVASDYKEQLEVVHSWFNERTFVAVGEIGLDYYWDTTHIVLQKEAFIEQIKCANDRNLPIVIHTRDSMDDAIDIVEQYADGITGIFHCFGGSVEQAKRIIDLGFYMGIGGVVTFKNTDLRETLKQIPLNHIVLETDSPYLAPVPYRGKRNESAYIIEVLNQVAEVYKLPNETIEEQTTKNTSEIFKIDLI